MIISKTFSYILRCGKLFHQDIVDMYAKTESERLLAACPNNASNRQLNSSLGRDQPNGNVTDVGRMVILPSSFIGSPRHRHEYAQDAMSYVRYYGHPDLLIIFTFNPEWPEMETMLYLGQLPGYRYDLTERIFKQKLKKLMDAMNKTDISRESRCWMYLIKWQKRGLVHAHILIWLEEKVHPGWMGDVTSAELPDPKTDAMFFRNIRSLVIHGSCGVLNPTSPCMKDEKCSKGYPRDYKQ